MGGIGTALGQVFRQNFPTESVGVFGSFQIYDRAAQADHAIDQLSLRQQQLITAKDMNQAQVDVTNSVVALRQAQSPVRGRCPEPDSSAATPRRGGKEIQSRSVDALQRGRAAARSGDRSVFRAGGAVTYQSARISLDQTTGATLEANHISLADAEKGIIPQPSTLPAVLPGPN